MNGLILFSRGFSCLLLRRVRRCYACAFLMIYIAFGVIIGSEPAAAADAIPGEEFCNREIESIRFVGNDVTKAAVLIRELPQKLGAQCSLDDIIDGIQNIQDLSLIHISEPTRPY